MRFQALYVPISNPALADYYRQVTAATQSEARRIAGRYERKGYRLASMTQINDNNA